MKRLIILAAIAIVLAGAAMIVPVAYRIATECELKPAGRRTVTLPFDSTLRRTVRASIFSNA